MNHNKVILPTSLHNIVRYSIRWRGYLKSELTWENIVNFFTKKKKLNPSKSQENSQQKEQMMRARIIVKYMYIHASQILFQPSRKIWSNLVGFYLNTLFYYYYSFSVFCLPEQNAKMSCFVRSSTYFLVPASFIFLPIHISLILNCLFD